MDTLNEAVSFIISFLVMCTITVLVIIMFQGIHINAYEYQPEEYEVVEPRVDTTYINPTFICVSVEEQLSCYYRDQTKE